MPLPDDLSQRARVTLERLLPRLRGQHADDLGATEWEAFSRRLSTHFEALFTPLYELYGGHYDFFFHVEAIADTLARAWIERPGDLRALDALRADDPAWFCSSRLVGATCYVDLFAGGFASLAERLPYLRELGITYLHLMPVFKTPPGEDDGGYAISDYRQTDPALGTIEELRDLATLLRHHGVALALDFVLNHTADDHPWARAALAGDREHQDYYLMYPDRRAPDAYERSLQDVFPDDHDGSFSYRPRMKRWVWTTFHTFQWDLNYANPAVFRQMTEEMLFIANLGVDVLRMDAVAFLWKELGTSCQNLPQSHSLLRAFSAAARIAAPAVALKSEAIVHPDEVTKYIAPDECQMSYNPQLMALLWDALATRKTTALRLGLEKRFSIPEGCSWVNYIRCHDDIGWAFDDAEVEAAGFDPRSHRKFLTQFYTGRHEASFARGVVFQENPVTGDARVSGMTASLTGLEQAIEDSDDHEADLAVRRLLLLYGVAMTIGGVPLVYLGDEIATLNDYTYRDHPEKRGDSRWLHRPAFDWERAEQRHDPLTAIGRVFQGFLRLVQLRTQSLAFDRSETEVVDLGNEHVLGYMRSGGEHSALVVTNFTEQPQAVDGKRLRGLGLRRSVVDTHAGAVVDASSSLELDPYQLMVLATPGAHSA